MTEQAEAEIRSDPGPEVQRDSALQAMARRHRIRAEQDQAAFGAALRVAFGRMAADCPGLDGVVQNVSSRQAALAEVLDMIEPGVFLAILEGRGEAMGLVVACPVVMAGMIEAQTTGRVDTFMPPKRKPTRTDAALMAPMIDAFLRRVDQRCAELPQGEVVTGYVYGSYLDDPRPLGLMLDEGQFHIIHLRVSLGFGAKEGDWYLIVPEPVAGKAAPNDIDQAEAEERDWQERLQVAVGSSEVVVKATLGRVQITLTEALRLRPGDVLRLPESALETLVLESITHEPLGIGRLGQARGQRAVRLTADPGVLNDMMGASAKQLALPAQIIPFAAPQAAFVPESDIGSVMQKRFGEDHSLQPGSMADPFPEAFALDEPEQGMAQPLSPEDESSEGFDMEPAPFSFDQGFGEIDPDAET
ncbi:MAG: hypothetical protein EA339_12860 [Rhodobacteraceae bacterium]|nr:MAG: hypothetical protein EA339_12860 [Paracoccaceae bacterium]